MELIWRGKRIGNGQLKRMNDGRQRWMNKRLKPIVVSTVCHLILFFYPEEETDTDGQMPRMMLSKSIIGISKLPNLIYYNINEPRNPQWA
jgi:hypothetical protein